MPSYAIGDIQGCYRELRQLLELVAFDPRTDRLWFTGDLVNRGPQSLEVLRFVRELGDRAVCVLGNHDLHLLAIAQGNNCKTCRHDTLNEILTAADRTELLDWLRYRPLLHHDTMLNYTLLHAGLPPQWDLQLAQAYANEVEQQLRGPHCGEFLSHLYGDEPNAWDPDLVGWDRLRFIVNCFTRLRYCSPQGVLCLDAKGPQGTQPSGYRPWFAIADRNSRDLNIVFGHWSTLNLTPAQMHRHRAYGLDTGCLWGGALTAMRLEDRAIFQVQSSAPDRYSRKRDKASGRSR
jgi:bis(5'-nucleosyl)-tetraphosphatase (symmetrical)